MNNDLISRSELTKELRERLVACNDWEEKAKDKETRIRANAVKTFICEMFMLLKEIPTVEQKEFEQVLQPITVDVSKVDIEKIKEELNNSFNTVTTEQLFSDCERLHVEPEPVSERQKRALAIVDALTEKRLINVMKRGCLRRSILLKPERPQGESKTVQDCIIAYGDGFESARRLFERPHGEWIEFKYGLYYCSNCFDKVDKDIDRIEHLVAKRDLSPFCPFCGSLMKGKGKAYD